MSLVAADPHKAAAAMKKHWVALGYSVRTVFERGAELAYGAQIAVDFPNGASLGYSVNTSLSIIDGAGVCLPTESFPKIE